jgi:hypothetical protein
MGGESPNVILYDVNGQEMSVSNGAAIPAGTSALMIAGSDGTDSRFFTLDTSGRLVVVGAAASGSAIAGNPVLVGGIDGVGVDARTLTVAVDRAAMTAGAATGVPSIGQSFGTARILRTNRLGHYVPGYQTLLAMDPIEMSNINTWLWTTTPTPNLTRIQQFTETTYTAGATATGVPSAAFTVGDLLEVACACSGATTFTVSAPGLTFTQAVSINPGGSGNTFAVFYAVNIPATSPTLTVTAAGSGTATTFVATEYHGVTTSSTLVSSTSGSATGSAASATLSSLSTTNLLSISSYDSDTDVTTASISSGSLIPGMDETNTILRGGDYQQIISGSATSSVNTTTGLHASSGIILAQYAAAVSTIMTIVQSNGLLILNANSVVASGAYCILASNKQFPMINQSPIGCSFKSLVTQTTNAINELGFGSATTTTAIISNGAFFRIKSSGNIYAVTSSNGTETVSASLGTIVNTTYYLFFVWIEDGGARFIIESETGIPLVDYFAPLTLSTPNVANSVSHLPVFSRVYNTGTAGAAPQTTIAGFEVWQYDINTSRPWSHQLGSAGRDSNISPLYFNQTTQLQNAAAPTVFTPSNTVAGNAYLGGEAAITMTATSESLLSVFAYQVPSPYTLVIDSININPPAVTTALGTTTTILEWVLIIASSGNLSTATFQFRRSLGFHTAIASAAAGVIFVGNPIDLVFPTPIACLPGYYVHLAVKAVRAGATGVYRVSCNIGGYYE